MSTFETVTNKISNILFPPKTSEQKAIEFVSGLERSIEAHRFDAALPVKHAVQQFIRIGDTDPQLKDSIHTRITSRIIELQKARKNILVSYSPKGNMKVDTHMIAHLKLFLSLWADHMRASGRIK